MWDKVQETVNYLVERTGFTPRYGIILGSGLGGFAAEIQIEHSIPYNQIPNFPVSTVLGHGGEVHLR